MAQYSWNEVKQEQMNPRFARRVIHGEQITMAQVLVLKGCIVPMHQHVNEQITTVNDGRVRFVIDGAEKVLGPGEVVQIGPNVPHSAEALEDSSLLEVFSPVRSDWKDGSDQYLRG